MQIQEIAERNEEIIQDAVNKIDEDLSSLEGPHYDAEAMDELVAWMESVLGVSKDIPPKALAQCLKDGVILCNLINAIKPGTIPKVNSSDLQYKQRENIQSFLRACATFGVPPEELCEVVDIYEEKSTTKVIGCLFSLGRAVQTSVPEFRGAKLRPDVLRSSTESTRFPSFESELAAREWLSAVSGLSIGEEESLSALLKNGVLLCEVVNKLLPGSVPKIEDSKLPFKQMENIKRFLQACRNAGLTDSETFETNDLFDAKVPYPYHNHLLNLPLIRGHTVATI